MSYVFHKNPRGTRHQKSSALGRAAILDSQPPGFCASCHDRIGNIHVNSISIEGPARLVLAYHVADPVVGGLTTTGTAAEAAVCCWSGGTALCVGVDVRADYIITTPFLHLVCRPYLLIDLNDSDSAQRRDSCLPWTFCCNGNSGRDDRRFACVVASSGNMDWIQTARSCDVPVSGCKKRHVHASRSVVLMTAA